MGGDNSVRSVFRNLAHFEPSIMTDADGKARATFTLPDNLTTFKVYAVATGHGRLSGTGQKDILVTKDVLVRSSLPAFASLGDEFTAAVSVTNRTAERGEARVTFSAENMNLLEPATREKTVPLEPSQSVEVGFPVTTASLGKAVFDFGVSMGSDSDKAVFEINVLPINDLTTQASFRLIEAGKTDSAADGMVSIALSLPEGTDPDRGEISASLAPSLVPLVRGPMDFLQTYPYDCLEQLTSKAFGALLSLRLGDRMALEADKKAELKAQVETHVNLLEKRILSGGFTNWTSQTDYDSRNPVLTAFALDFLVSAREDGFKITDGLISDIGNFLGDYLNDPASKAKPWYSEDAVDSISLYAFMAMTKAGHTLPAAAEVYFDKANSLSAVNLVTLIRGIG
jgi:uncharacterized protein YfaS (alpha-2-macroglobulin family)